MPRGFFGLPVKKTKKNLNKTDCCMGAAVVLETRSGFVKENYFSWTPYMFRGTGLSSPRGSLTDFSSDIKIWGVWGVSVHS